MREARIENRVTSIPIGKLIAHPGNPNRRVRGTLPGWFVISSGPADMSRSWSGGTAMTSR